MKTFVYDVHMPLIHKQNMIEEDQEQFRLAFSDEQDSGDLAGLREDQGMESMDLFILDAIGEELTDEQADLLMANTSEAFDEILKTVKISPDVAEKLLFSSHNISEVAKERLYRMAFSKMLTEVTTDSQERKEKIINPDYEKLFNEFLLINESTVVALNKALEYQHLKDMVQIRHSMMDTWYKRFNNWLKTEKYQAYPHKAQAWETYKRVLKTRKEAFQKTNEAWQKVKPLLQPAWDEYMALSEMQKQFAASAPFLWTWLNELKDSEINTFLTSGETDDVDEYQLIATDQKELSDILQETHIQEMRDYDRPESEGSGFWSWREEKRQEYINNLRDEDSQYLESLMVA